MEQKVISWIEIYDRVKKLPEGKYWGIPRGGQVIAGLTGKAVDRIQDCDYIIDDLDSNTYFDNTIKLFYGMQSIIDYTCKGNNETCLINLK